MDQPTQYNPQGLNHDVIGLTISSFVAQHNCIRAHMDGVHQHHLEEMNTLALRLHEITEDILRNSKT